MLTRCVVLIGLGIILTGDPAAAQELRLLREVPGVWDGCPALPADAATRTPLAQRQEAERLAAEATQAAILGDNVTAYEFLQRAAQLDPSSADISYHLARTLEELGRPVEALVGYCHYAGLAADAPDIADVHDRIRTFAAATVTSTAARWFEAGIAHFDARRMREAETAFGNAIAAAPAWNAPAYNRAIVRLVQGRRSAAASDARTYLELGGDAALAGALATLAGPPPATGPRSYSPGGALVAGLLVPGLGHFTTDRPLLGALVLGTAVGAIAVGVSSQRLKVDCLSPPVDGRCPPDDVLRERTERPYMVPAIGVAAAVGVLGAIDAYAGARRRNGRAAGGVRTGATDWTDAGILALSRVRVGSDAVRVELVRLRF